jgi:hypothetical protein
MNLLRPFAGLAVVGLVLASCGGDDDVAETTTTSEATTTTSTTLPPTTTSSTSTTTTTTTVPVVIRHPLTGEALESVDDIIDRAALVVKIDNVDARQNHSGLGAADIVFEEVVEGRATRFAAIFHSQGSKPVGPIRSGRSQDVDLLTSLNRPLFVWSGGNVGVTRLINESSLINMGPGNANGYYRGPGTAPHNLYNDTDTIWAQTPDDHPGPPGQQFFYLDDGEEFGGDSVRRVDAPIGATRVGWEWNPDTGKFDRYQNGTLHLDVVHGQIAATNVVIMGVDYRPSRIDARSPEAQTVGEGPIYVFSDGKVVYGRWSRAVNLFSIEFFDLDGETIELNPGNTWIELAERAPNIESGINLQIESAG